MIRLFRTDFVRFFALGFAATASAMVVLLPVQFS